MLTIPAWAVGVLVAMVTGILGFAWKLAVKTERSAERLEETVRHLQALETRIASIDAIDRALAVMSAEHRHLSAEVSRLRDSVHAILRREQGGRAERE